MAGAILSKLAQKEGLNLEIDSCGTAALLGMSASKEAIEVLRREQIDISGHRSKNLQPQLLEWADLVLVMEKRHQGEIMERFPQAKEKVHLLSKFANGEEKDIIDPIGKPLEVYEGVVLDLKFYLSKVLERIKNEGSSSK